MANKQRGFVEIELDKKRKLRYTLNAVAEIEDKLGCAIQDLAEKNLGIKALRTMLWAGLLHEDKEITEEFVGDLVDFDNLHYAQEKITEAFALAAKNLKGEPKVGAN